MTQAYITPEVQQRVRGAARERCGYCQSQQRYVMGKLEIEHVIPRAAGGSNEEANLWLSCGLCNRYKGAQVAALDTVTQTSVSLFHPRRQNWAEHFAWSSDGVTIAGLTPTGRATVLALQLNNEIAIEVRRNWVLAGWHPPNI